MQCTTGPAADRTEQGAGRTISALYQLPLFQHAADMHTHLLHLLQALPPLVENVEGYLELVRLEAARSGMQDEALQQIMGKLQQDMAAMHASVGRGGDAQGRVGRLQADCDAAQAAKLQAAPAGSGSTDPLLMLVDNLNAFLVLVDRQGQGDAELQAMLQRLKQGLEAVRWSVQAGQGSSQVGFVCVCLIVMIGERGRGW